MTNDDHHRADTGSGKAGSAEPNGGKTEREAAAKAVLDNMARLRALRLAREAVQPKHQPPAAAKRAKSTTGRPSGKKEDAKRQALSDWLAAQQNGGHRT